VFLNAERVKHLVGRGDYKHYGPILMGMQNKYAVVHNETDVWIYHAGSRIYSSAGLRWRSVLSYKNT